MFGKKELFGSKIDPACGYCSFGKPTNDGSRILCLHVGVTMPHYSCRKFRYDPLLREPTRQQQLPKYDKSEFEL